MLLLSFLFLLEKNPIKVPAEIGNETSNNNEKIEPVSKSTELGISIGIELCLVAISTVSFILFRSSFSADRLEVFDAVHSDVLEEEEEEIENPKIESSIPEL